ncbi:MAG: hypothetical protein H6Q20_1396 [Bacteroidetes bacterium]|jgi:hypothetical protein|nr:hypothetical protein [Bacteroidota bacterium]
MIMKFNYLFSIVLFIGFCLPAQAQTAKKKPVKATTTATAARSKAEKMGYARTNKYWGPGTYYCYAPGTPKNKMADNAETAMRDLTGIFDTDLYKELAKQGFTEVPKKEVKSWFNESKSKDVTYYYSPDKSYVLQPSVKDMYNSPAMETGKYAYASDYMARYVLLPKADSLKVLAAVWQFMRDLNEMKVVLATFGSNFKNADPKAYPIQRAGSTGWTSMRAGTFVLKMVDGKPRGYWEQNDVIIRRTMGMTDFDLLVMGMETDYWYSLRVRLKKEGYVLAYNIVASNMKDLEPGNTWVKEYPKHVTEYTTAVKMDKDNIEVYKKAPLPPVLADFDKLLIKY